MPNGQGKGEKNFSRNFKKPLDKIEKVWYNKDSKEQETSPTEGRRKDSTERRQRQNTVL